MRVFKPRIFPVAIDLNEGDIWYALTHFPPLERKVSPLTIFIIPNVAIIGNTLNFATKTPIIAPTIAPIRIPSTIDNNGWIWGKEATVREVIMPERAMVDPIDKSIPLTIKTIIIPTDNIPKIDALIRSVFILSSVKKVGFLNWIITTISMIKNRSPISLKLSIWRENLFLSLSMFFPPQSSKSCVKKEFLCRFFCIKLCHNSPFFHYYSSVTYP